MATTRTVRAHQARKEALLASYLGLLISGERTTSDLLRFATQNRLEAECATDAVKRFRTDYPEHAE
jgi:hypothetical protein